MTSLTFKITIMRFLMILLFGGLGFTICAQEVSVDGINYEVKDERILKNGIDATDDLSVELKEKINHAAIVKRGQIKEAEKVEKRLKMAEKSQKSAEKKQKKAEKALKKKKKAQSDFQKSTKKYGSAQKNYDKLKKKGKLSPEDEEKWLEKIDKFKAQSEKAKKKL